MPKHEKNVFNKPALDCKLILISDSLHSFKKTINIELDASYFYRNWEVFW